MECDSSRWIFIDVGELWVGRLYLKIEVGCGCVFCWCWAMKKGKPEDLI
jgi:hypothetical protein